MTRAVWQISGGPASRSYAEVFLQHGVALIGPGDAGPWNPERDDDEFEGGFVRRFASEVKSGDVFLLRTGIAAIAAVGLVASYYLYVNAFYDVNGWDLQHARRALVPSPRGARVRKRGPEVKIHRRDTEGTEMELHNLTEQIIGVAIEVHKALGPGLLESAYEECLCRELTVRSIPFERQRPLPVEYKGTRLDCGYRLDLLVSGVVVVEIKSVSSIEPIHEAQLPTYLKLGGWKLGLLINFNVPVLKDGIRRRIL